MLQITLMATSMIQTIQMISLSGKWKNATIAGRVGYIPAFSRQTYHFLPAVDSYFEVQLFNSWDRGQATFFNAKNKEL